MREKPAAWMPRLPSALEYGGGMLLGAALVAAFWWCAAGGAAWTLVCLLRLAVAGLRTVATARLSRDR